MTISKWSFLMVVLFATLGMIGCQQNATTESTNEKITEIEWTTNSEQAKALFKTALHLSEMGDDQASRAIFTKAIEQDPEFAMAYIHRAFTAASAEEFAQDIKKAEAYQDKLSDPEKRILAITKTFLKNDLDQELALAQAFANDYPELSRAQSWLGYAYQSHEQHEKAREAFQKSIELDPKWVGGYLPLGMSYIFSEPKDLNKAEKYLSESLALAPNSEMANVNMGDCYRAQNNLEKALVYYQKATEINPKDAVAHSKTGHINSLLGNYQEARANYQKSKSLSDFKASAINFEAYTYLYEGKPKEALTFLNNQIKNIDALNIPSTRVSSSKMFFLNSASWMALHNGDAKQLKALLAMRAPVSIQIGDEIGTDEARKNQKANELMWEGLTAVLEKDTKKARNKADMIKTTLEGINNPNKLENYHFLLGYTDLADKRYTDAVQQLKQANYKNNMYTKFLLAMANEKAGNTKESMKLLSELADYNFNNVGYALIRKEVKDKLAANVTS